VAIEPYLSDQWYVKVTDDRLRGFAQRALVEDQRTTETYRPVRGRMPAGGTGIRPVPSSEMLDQPRFAAFRPEGFIPRDPFPAGEAIPNDLMGYIRNLPHVELPGATYFVTWRTVPGAKLSEEDRSVVLDALRHFDGERCHLYAAVVMPDHVHCIVRPLETVSLADWTASVKRFSATEIHKRTNGSGALWQDERFDHVIRDERWLAEFFRYVVWNPVEAELINRPSEYRWTFVHSDVERAIGPSRHGSDTRATEDTDGSMRFYPDRYAKTYELWHDNLRDWCISRQLWWGHRIPVWTREFSESRVLRTSESATAYITEFADGTKLYYEFSDDDERAYNAVEAIENDHPELWIERRGFRSGSTDPNMKTMYLCLNQECAEAERQLEEAGFVQDPDVLDTWFSSALWPLNTMGWPEPEQADATRGLLDAFNPTDVLCTAREIITLWVSRMVMFNRYFLSPDGGKTPGRIPYRDVFIHAMIQDGEGRKMSKSLGNGVDPLDIIHSHGSDAMRFTLCKMTTQTQDVRMPVEVDPETGRNTSPKFDEGRNFCTKLWNAARFALMKLSSGSDADRGVLVSMGDLTLADRWMLSRLAAAVETVEESLAGYRFSEYAQTIYDLLWRDFCDWYLEAVKPTIESSPAQRAVVHQTLDAILRLLHPIAPFITEEVWTALREAPHGRVAGLEAPDGAEMLCIAEWPTVRRELRDEGAEKTFERLRTLVETIRRTRSEHDVKSKERLTLHGDAGVVSLVGEAGGLVETLAGLEAVTAGAPSGEAFDAPFEGGTVRLSGFERTVDAGALRAQLADQVSKLEKDIGVIEKRLGNPGYVQKAPAHLVEETRSQLAAKQGELARLRDRLKEVG